MSISQEVFNSKTAYVPRIDQIEQSVRDFMDEQIALILRHRATTHPFLVRYAEEGLPPNASKILFLETLHYFKHLPFYVCGISTITRDEAVLRAITFNAQDELGIRARR